MTRMTLTETELMTKAQEIVSQNLTVLKPQLKSPEQQLFLAALSIIENPKNWCRGRTAMKEIRIAPVFHIATWSPDDINNMKIEYKTEKKVHYRYCSIGAIYAAAGYDPEKLMLQLPDNVNKVMRILRSFFGSGTVAYSIAGFNDTHSHAEVIEAWKACGRQQGWL